MSESSQSGYQRDIADQPDALTFFAAQPLPAPLATLDFGRFDRIILTGMGSSDNATIPLELTLARRGLPVWRLQTSRLLETPEMITDRTLLWITSQSGRSGEVVALMERLPPGRRGTVVATTNDPQSPIALGADHALLIHSGAEATVSTKSYLNSLAGLLRVSAAVQGRADADAEAVAEIRDLAGRLRTAIAAPDPAIAALAQRTVQSPNPRLALVGAGPDSATALTGALILKESCKVMAEGFVGGAFRHGPLEIAGPGLTVLMFGTGAESDITLRHLARDLAPTGSIVVAVSPRPYEGAEHIAIDAPTEFMRMGLGMHVLQQLSLGLAHGAGIVPGAFRFGQKITALL